MQNKRIYAIGETVFDLIFKNQQPVASRAGGAMLNTAVSLGRLGLPVDLITEIGNDEVGNQIIKFLDGNDVGTQHIFHYDKGKTALALAFIDEFDEAQYTFYKQYPKQRMKINEPVFNKDDLVLFGSFAAITPELRNSLMKLLTKASDAGAIIIYDPNFRKPHLNDLKKLKPFIIENIQIADIVRGSMDDFQLIFEAWNTQEAFYHVSDSGCQLMIATSADGPAYFKSETLSLDVETPEINPVSTIGAGDSFNAGLIFGLTKLHVQKNDLFSLKAPEWETLLNIGIAFGSRVCESYDNYIPHSFAAKLKH